LLDDAGQPVHSDAYENEHPKRGKTGFRYCVNGGGRAGRGGVKKVNGLFQDFHTKELITVPNSRFDWTDEGIRQCVAVNDAYFAARYAESKDARWLEKIAFKTVEGEEVRPNAHSRARLASRCARSASPHRFG
jgi:hypothetical protein